MNKEMIYIYLALASVSILIGSMIGATSVQSTWQLDAAQTTCAQFNPENGHFEWIPKILEVPHRKSNID